MIAPVKVVDRHLDCLAVSRFGDPIEVKNPKLETHKSTWGARKNLAYRCFNLLRSVLVLPSQTSWSKRNLPSYFKVARTITSNLLVKHPLTNTALPEHRQGRMILCQSLTIEETLCLIMLR